MMTDNFVSGTLWVSMILVIGLMVVSVVCAVIGGIQDPIEFTIPCKIVK